MHEPTFRGLRVLLFEREPQDIELIEQTLVRADPLCVVRVVGDEPTFVHALDEFAPEVVLSDYGTTEFDVCRAFNVVQKRRPECPFLVVSGAFEASATHCMKRGAEDFVSTTEITRLPRAIQAALSVRAAFYRLSDRQRQVFRLLAEGASTRDIAKRLSVSIKTVETHRSHVMKRLGVRDLASLVRYAVRVGLIPAEE